MGHWSLVNCTERSRKACGIATLRAQPLVEKYWSLVIGYWLLILFPHSLIFPCLPCLSCSPAPLLPCSPAPLPPIPPADCGSQKS